MNETKQELLVEEKYTGSQQELSERDIEEVMLEIGASDKYSGSKNRGNMSTESIDKQVKAMLTGKENNFLLRQQRKVDIKREYVSSNRSHLLEEVLDITDLSKLITALTLDTFKKSEYLKRIINAKVTRALKDLMPRELKTVYTKYPQAFIAHPGFLYLNSEFYGGYKIWLTPDIPYFFEQFSEMQILQSTDDGKNFVFDRLIEKYFVLRAEIAKDEIKLATKFEKTKTRLDLIDLNVAYYDAYIKILQQDGRE